MKKRFSPDKRYHTISFVLLCMLGFFSFSASFGQSVMFDFNNATDHAPFPIDINNGGISAHFSATGEGFSIQQANVMGLTPAGFDGLIIYPSSVFAADLLISFNQSLSDFSIMYSPQELGFDDSATMRVTTFMNETLVGSNTAVVPNPGTWPTGILACSFPSGFNKVVVHYDSHPPTCQDYGVIFMADNMQVTPSNLAVSNSESHYGSCILNPNPVTESTTLSFSLLKSENINIALYDIRGQAIATLFNNNLSIGFHELILNLNILPIESGIYFLKLRGENATRTFKLLLIK